MGCKYMSPPPFPEIKKKMKERKGKKKMVSTQILLKLIVPISVVVSRNIRHYFRVYRDSSTRWMLHV